MASTTPVKYYVPDKIALDKEITDMTFDHMILAHDWSGLYESL